ncbi:hypothetical protein MMC17_000804 [Xylographa soralifera]|nr:hypothetical protein [Xylographa soralifera]
MTPRAPYTLPTSSALPSYTRLPPSHTSVFRILTRLSRSSLLALIQEWLKTENIPTCGPNLAGHNTEDDSTYKAAQSSNELQEAYSELQNGKGGKREVLDRVIEGDWRHGISLRQLAMADVQYLLDHPVSQRWNALRLVLVSPALSVGGSEIVRPVETLQNLPRFHAPTFCQNLQREIGSLMKAHYHFTRLSPLPVTLLRIFVTDSPYDSQLSGPGKAPTSSSTSATTLYVAFPDNTPFIYISLTTATGMTSGDAKSLRKLVIGALPKAISKPRERYSLKPTSLSARSLDALVTMRGPSGGLGSSGGWKVFADGTIEPSPLRAHVTSPIQPDSNDEDKENIPAQNASKIAQNRVDIDAERSLLANDEVGPIQKRRQLVAQARFGEDSLGSGGKGLERFEVRLENTCSRIDGRHADSSPRQVIPVAGSKRKRSTLSLEEEPSEEIVDGEEEAISSEWKPSIQLTFSGSNVFAGLRKMVEAGAINGEKMPGWMTGENMVSVGAVRDGRMRGNKGSGIW